MLRKATLAGLTLAAAVPLALGQGAASQGTGPVKPERVSVSECWKQFEEHMKACMVLFGPGGQIPDEDAKRACFEGAREALYACLD